MDSYELARYIEETDSISKPWMLVQLRILKLQERRSTLSDTEYMAALTELHEDLMNLGEWWKGQEDKVF
ncbi:hypothetical protein C7H19_02885 [Aphanothece hegewaldii CCALA 016]|uniref:Uncharacterized protein n=1 Tax=Aphanothece hegewaldii CCALA 016 TaxID=2107694 RepID=A0A2T1M2N5_9CHRO|nr:hypothetical protein [Aphanothece hegewaldii]PSF39015.1 hypothetical protein C7H19_02885 [Aphanothece hegewaldii CCALA 016]